MTEACRPRPAPVDACRPSASIALLPKRQAWLGNPRSPSHWNGSSKHHVHLPRRIATTVWSNRRNTARHAPWPRRRTCRAMRHACPPAAWCGPPAPARPPISERKVTTAKQRRHTTHHWPRHDNPNPVAPICAAEYSAPERVRSASNRRCLHTQSTLSLKASTLPERNISNALRH